MGIEIHVGSTRDEMDGIHIILERVLCNDSDIVMDSEIQFSEA